MRLFDRHPSGDALADFALPEPSVEPGRRKRIASHLERCATCRDCVQLLRGVTRALGKEDQSGPPAELRGRILASRLAGARTILPAGSPPARPRARLLPWAAAVVLMSAVAFSFGGTREADAGATAGALSFEPAFPRRGDVVRVAYDPVATLSGEHRLVLRARLRTPSDESYNSGLTVVTLASLSRDSRGTFKGEFTFPANSVFGAFVIEDASAARVDANDGRLWELLTSDDGVRPTFEALNQRVNDLMGRNWEEGHATVKRMTQLYPDEIRSWSWLSNFDGWLGLAEVDSVKSRHRARLAAFDVKLRDVYPLDPHIVANMYWYARSTDRTFEPFWTRRLLAEASNTPFGIQERLRLLSDSFEVTKDTTHTLAELNALWKEAPRQRLVQVAGTGFNLARLTRDTASIRLWSERIVSGSANPVSQERSIAEILATMDAFRAEGIERIRHSVALLDSLSEGARQLGDTRQAYALAVSRNRRRTMAALGRALVADGRAREGLEVLSQSAEEGWDLFVLRAARTASLTAGDTAGAMVFAARIAKDPRTDITAADSDRAVATKLIGAPAWEAALKEAERAFMDRMLLHAPMTSLRGRARLRDLNGVETDVATLAAGQVTVVAIWSRSCGPAVSDLPNIGRVATRLAAKGVRTISVVEERTLTPELAAFLAERKVEMPVYLDSYGDVAKAFNSWGTPAYYVLDNNGRVRFAATSDASELLARAEAVRLEMTSR